MTTTPTRPKVFHAPELIREVRESTAFEEEMARPNARLATAFTHAALELAELETLPSGERTMEGYGYLLASQLNGVIDSIVALEQNSLPRSVRATHKNKLSGFNHDMRHMIDAYPDLTPADIQRLLVQAYIAAHRNEWTTERQAREQVNTISEAVGSSIYGMWSEVAGELVIAEAGFEIDTDVTDEEELKGIDGWVLMRPERGNDGWMPVDFKSDREKAARINAREPGQSALWSQFARKEYSPTQSFRISRELLKSKVPGMKRDLEDLYRWYSR